MRRSIDWGTWLSLLCVAAAVTFGGWQLARRSSAAKADGVPASVSAEPDMAIDAGSASDAGTADGAAPRQGRRGPGSRMTEESTEKSTGRAPAHRSSFNYRLNAPDETLVLTDALSEISDLALAADGESLWAVHDERGALFRLAMKDGSVLQTLDFHKKGDFEGVALVHGQVYAGRGDGVLFVVDPGTGATTHFDSGLGGQCDLEGLAFDEKTSRLLMSCKSPTGSGAGRAWAVYSLDPATQVMDKKPVLRVTATEIEVYLAEHPEQTELQGSMARQFDPSGIAVHPQSGLIYIISTRGQLLMVLDRNGQSGQSDQGGQSGQNSQNGQGGPTGRIIRIDSLLRTVHRQPEGIAFLPDGTLFLSNEARGLKPVLQRFSPVKE